MTLRLVIKKWQCFYQTRHLKSVCFGQWEFFLLLHAEDNNNRQNFPYWKYSRFALQLLHHDKCLSDFRLTKKDTIYFVSFFWTCSICHVVSSIQARCIVLMQLAYPWRYDDMILRFGRSVSENSIIFNRM